MSEAILWIFIGFMSFLLIRRVALSYVSRVVQRKLFEQEYLAVLKSAQFKVKSKYD